MPSVAVVKDSLTTESSSSSPSLKMLQTCKLMFCLVFAEQLNHLCLGLPDRFRLQPDFDGLVGLVENHDVARV